jgi:hypothetical protein
MTTYLILDGQLRAETDEFAIANLRRKGWQDAPAKPSDDAQWQDGAWVVPPVATFTAEEIVSRHFSPYQIQALSRLEMALLAANKPLGPQMTAAKQWLENVLLGWAVSPVAAPAEAFGVPSVTFEQASAEAVSSLNSQP